MIRWSHNDIREPSNELVSTAGNTTALLIRNPQPSDAGVYRCSFVELNLQMLIELG